MRFAVAAAAALLLAGTALAEPLPAAGGVRLFPALERSSRSVVGILEAPRALDDEAYAAVLRVEVVLAGDVARGARIPIAWEERARARPVRFEDGDRLLLVIAPLSGASIWRQRLPDPKQRLATWAIAERGDAFLRGPASGSVQLIEHFLALPSDLRAGNPGVAHLIRLAEGAQPTLALAAVERLAAVSALDRAIDPTSAVRLVKVLMRAPDRLGERALDLVDQKQLESLREPLTNRALPDASGPAPAYEALGRLDAALPADLVRALLERPDSAAHRTVGARYAGTASLDRLARLLRRDTASEVRAAAVTRLVELHGVSEIDRVLFALEDPHQSVRNAAMLSIAGLGSEAVPSLSKVVEGGSVEAARTAVGALRASGPEGVRVLSEIVDDHPDESVRTLARIALGRPIGHRHD